MESLSLSHFLIYIECLFSVCLGKGSLLRQKL